MFLINLYSFRLPQLHFSRQWSGSENALLRLKDTLLFWIVKKITTFSTSRMQSRTCSGYAEAGKSA